MWTLKSTVCGKWSIVSQYEWVGHKDPELVSTQQERNLKTIGIDRLANWEQEYLRGNWCRKAAVISKTFLLSSDSLWNSHPEISKQKRCDIM